MPDEPPESTEPGEPTDAWLIERVLSGERERFSALVDRHGRALFGYLRRRTRDRESARDVFQETWLHAMEGLAALRDPDRVRAWLISIAHNRMRRRTRRSEPLPLEHASPPLAPETNRDSLERAEIRGAVASAMASLPPKQREVFELRVLHELSYAEIAAQLEIREENARAHLYQALRKLRAQLGGDDGPG